jgi:hypothetical protein
MSNIVELKPRKPDHLCKLFNIECVKCKSVNVKFIREFDDESGETGFYLFCPQCRQRERLPGR